MYIVAGLGNPGSGYENTRHNVGFKAVDRLASLCNAEINRAKFKGLIAETRIGSEKVILLKPQTFMNLSGQSVADLFYYYKIPEDHLIVIYDDFDLPVGTLRIRKSGGPGTHNGMKSVVSVLGFSGFPRIRIGIGGSRGDAVDHVIGKVPKSEQAVLEEAEQAAAEAARDIILLGIDNAMNRHNTRKKQEKNDD